LGTIIRDPDDFTGYAAQLERQNRMLKRVGACLFLGCFSAIALIGWQLKRVADIFSIHNPRMISARQFNLVDDKGNIQGALVSLPEGPFFRLGKPDKGGLSFDELPGEAGTPDTFSLRLSSPSGKQHISLFAGDRASSVTVGTGISLDKDNIQIMAGEFGQRVTVSDELGYQAILGETWPLTSPTGGSMTTSGAALTLLSKDGHVTWMVPKP